MLYIKSIILCLEEWFGDGDGENVKIDTRIVYGDKIVHNICTLLVIHNWMLSDGIPVNSDNVVVFIRVWLESIEILFSCFEEVFLKISSNVNLGIMRKEYISIIIYSLSHLKILWYQTQGNFGSFFVIGETLDMESSISPSWKGWPMV